MLSAGDVSDRCTALLEVLWSGAVPTAVHHYRELILDALRHIKPMKLLV